MRPKPVHLRLSPDTHPPDARLAAWRAALGFSHDLIVTPEQREGFRAGFDAYSLGPVLIADMRSTAHQAFRDKALIARHALDVVAVDAVLEGGIAGTFGARRASAGPGDCILVDLLTPMRADVADHRIVTLVVPRPLFAERVTRRACAGGRVLPAASPEARLVAAHLGHLLAVAPDLTPPLAEAAGLACLDLVAACLGPRPRAQPLRPKRRKRREAPTPPLDLGRVGRLIERDLARPDLGAEMMMEHFGVSRATLYRLMEPLGGVAATVRRHRAAEAHRLLTTPAGQDLTAEEVALRCGFVESRTMRRALRDLYGASARELRQVQRLDEEERVPPVDPETSAWIDAV